MEETLNLKSISNTSLLSMYKDYNDTLIRHIIARDNTNDKKEKEYWIEKVNWEMEVYLAVEHEILSRMSGMEID